MIINNTEEKIEITCPICFNKIEVYEDLSKVICQCGAEMAFWETVNEKFEKELFVYVTNQPVLVKKGSLKNKK